MIPGYPGSAGLMVAWFLPGECQLTVSNWWIGLCAGLMAVPQHQSGVRMDGPVDGSCHGARPGSCRRSIPAWVGLTPWSRPRSRQPSNPINSPSPDGPQTSGCPSVNWLLPNYRNRTICFRLTLLARSWCRCWQFVVESAWFQSLSASGESSAGRCPGVRWDRVGERRAGGRRHLILRSTRTVSPPVTHSAPRAYRLTSRAHKYHFPVLQLSPSHAFRKLISKE